MTTIYIANTAGDGLSPETAFRPSGFDGQRFTCLMVDPARARAIVLSQTDGITGTGIQTLVTAASLDALRTAAQNTTPAAARRTQINTWLTAAGYATLPANVTTWWDVIHFVARQVNLAADLAVTSAQ